MTLRLFLVAVRAVMMKMVALLKRLRMMVLMRMMIEI